MSETTNQFLTDVLQNYITKPRGEVQLKGGDTLFTFWLLGKKTKGIEVDFAEIGCVKCHRTRLLRAPAATPSRLRTNDDGHETLKWENAVIVH